MASVKSRNQRGNTNRKDEDDFRNWRSPHHKSSADHFRHGAGSRREREGHSSRENHDGYPDRHDRAGSHRTRYRESKPHRWSSDHGDRRAEPRSRKLDLQSTSEFPVLGAKEMNASYTPDPVRSSSQRHISTSSTDWASKIEQFEKDKERALKDMIRYKRRLLMSESSDGSNEDQENMIDINAEPRKKYETDETVLVRRQKQLDLGKNTLGYDQYLQKYPKYKRVKNTHIATPNKFQKCSRRAWDGLIRQWRRKLHEYDPEGTYKPEQVARKELLFSDNTSDTTSEASSEARMDVDLNNSMSSAISDYLASNEGSRPDTPDDQASRPETPDQTSRPETPTAELKGLTVGDHMNGNYQTTNPDIAISNSNAGVTPNATQTPTGTPADHEVEGQTFLNGPQVNPSDLIAALRHAAQVMQASIPVNPMTPNMYCVQPLTSNLNPNFRPDVSIHSFSSSNDSAKMTKESKERDIFDNFNLDDCFVTEKDIIG